jgi:pSer/pThr/pTyr-binding forkhead associated (FHA) protein
MALTIVVLTGEGADEARLQLSFDAPRVVIGRGDGCEVRLPDPSVSLRHASIRQRGAEYVVLDEGSTNGTFLGRVRLSPQSPRVLRSGERVRAGRVWLEALIEAAPIAPSSPAHAEGVALELVRRGLAAQGEDARPRVRVVAGPDEGKELVIAEASRRYLVGRNPAAALALEEPRAARRHVELATRGKDVVVRDLGAELAPTLDGAPLGRGDVVWRPGRLLAIGGDALALEHPAAEALAELERSPDEPIPPDETIAEPPGAPEPSESPPPAHVEPAAPASPAPLDAGPPTEIDETGGWTLLDGAVVLAAIGVLALSIAGLVWILR